MAIIYSLVATRKLSYAQCSLKYLTQIMELIGGKLPHGPSPPYGTSVQFPESFAPAAELCWFGRSSYLKMSLLDHKCRKNRASKNCRSVIQIIIFKLGS